MWTTYTMKLPNDGEGDAVASESAYTNTNTSSLTNWFVSSKSCQNHAIWGETDNIGISRNNHTTSNIIPLSNADRG